MLVSRGAYAFKPPGICRPYRPQLALYSGWLSRWQRIIGRERLRYFLRRGGLAAASDSQQRERFNTPLATVTSNYAGGG
jgi:hypothetical protein